MCHQVKVLKNTKNGSISCCLHCNCYQLAFKNFLYEFTDEELDQFSFYISQIDPQYWEEFYNNCNLIRKIPIATYQANLVLMIDGGELEELKTLLFYKKETSPKYLQAFEINYHQSLN